MSTTTIRTCDFCGGAEVRSDAGKWRVLAAKDGTTALDVCPVCVARLRAPVANAGLLPLGRRLVEVHTGTAL